MKTRSWLLTVVAAISALALVATPAEAGGKKKHRHHGWNNGGYTHYHRSWHNRGYGYYRPYRYYRAPYYGSGYYRPYRYYRAPYYGPVYYSPAPVFVVQFGFN
jgi:hypothetical protein